VPNHAGGLAFPDGLSSQPPPQHHLYISLLSIIYIYIDAGPCELGGGVFFGVGAKILAVVQKANMLFCGHGRPFLPIGTTLSTQSPHELP
jgi:hypothetical protein